MSILPPTALARPPHAFPTHADAHRTSEKPRSVLFRHPGYPPSYNILLALSAADGPSAGLHHETARIACAIIAGNRWDGFLAVDSAGTPVDMVPDGLLTRRDYYFHVPGTRDWPVVPNFRQWRFPHDNMPSSWLSAQRICEEQEPPPSRAVSTLTAALTMRDGSCRLSACEEGCQSAHLVPVSEEEWYSKNSMGTSYALQPRRTDSVINDSRNAMLLRSDLHFAFDNMRFVCVPKPQPLGKNWCPFVVHLLDPLAHELRRLYHNVPLQMPLGVGFEFLFARFAWAVFPLLEEFLRQPTARTLLVTTNDSPLLMTPEQSLAFTRKALRSTSPKKRSRPAEPETQAQNHDDENDTERQPDASARPRKRTRRSSREQSQHDADPAVAPRPRKQLRRSARLSPPEPGPSSPAAAQRFSPPSDAPPRLTDSQTSLSDDELGALYSAHLEKERLRSDPAETWKAEREWLREAATRPLSQNELQRYWTARGYEVLD